MTSNRWPWPQDARQGPPDVALKGGSANSRQLGEPRPPMPASVPDPFPAWHQCQHTEATTPRQTPLVSAPSLFRRAFWGSACCLVNKSRAAGIIYLSNSSQLPISAVSLPGRAMPSLLTWGHEQHISRGPCGGEGQAIPRGLPTSADQKKNFQCES